MYIEKMEKYVNDKKSYLEMIKITEENADKIRNDYFLEKIGQNRYNEIKKYMTIFNNIALISSSVDKTNNELNNIIDKCLQNIRSSSTPFGATWTKYNNVKELRLYPNGIGTFDYGYTNKLSISEYKNIIINHGDAMLKKVWKGNKKMMLEILNDELPNWIDIPIKEMTIKFKKKIQVPNDNGIVVLDNIDLTLINIRIHDNNYYTKSGIVFKSGWYNRIYEICDKLSIKDMFMIDQIYDELSKELPLSKLKAYKQSNDNNNDVLKRIKIRILPYLASEEI